LLLLVVLLLELLVIGIGAGAGVIDIDAAHIDYMMLLMLKRRDSEGEESYRRHASK
jgi:hypothetical protein